MKAVYLIIALAILLVLVGPLLVIWAWNTLFTSSAIEYSLATWAAVVILGGFFRANVSVKK